MSMSVHCPQGHPLIVAANRREGKVLCPHCFTSFLIELPFSASAHARKADTKSRRSRDDDDDDDDDDEDEDEEDEDEVDDDEEEEELPRKKAKSKKPDGDEEKPRSKKKDDEKDEVDKPRSKKQARKKGAEEVAEEEVPIEWSPRKRALNVCANGLIAFLIGWYVLIAYTVFTTLWVALFETDLFGDKGAWGVALYFWFSVPLGYLGLAALLAGMFFNFALPAKAEGRGSLIAAIVVAIIMFLIGVFAALTAFGAIVSDPARQVRFVELLNYAAIICFIVCMLSLMGYLAKLMIFMKLHLESSQPITNMGFLLAAYAGMLGLVFISQTLKNNLGGWACYVVVLAAVVCAAFAVYMLILLIFLTMRIRLTITKYIKDA